FPMMAGQGQFGPIGMGGMFTLLKVRADQKPDDYTDPGDYAYPAGTVAYEYTGPVPDALRPTAAATPADTTRHGAAHGHGHGHGHAAAAAAPATAPLAHVRKPRGGQH
nr:copper oxidase [Burkholderiaceae bacterium]